MLAEFGYLQSKRPFSNSRVDKLGEFYTRRRSEPPEEQKEILQWYNQLCINTLHAGRAIITSSEVSRLGGLNFDDAYRVKIRTSIADKIKRSSRLSAMQDFAGVRFDVDATHSTILRIAEKLAECASTDNVEVQIRNYLGKPQMGYRAVHVWITSQPAGRIEIQLRTRMQAAWANTFERLADCAGRQIRYEPNFIPDDRYLASTLVNLMGYSNLIYSSEVNLDKRYDLLVKNLSYLRETAEEVPRNIPLLIERAKLLRNMADGELLLAEAARHDEQSVRLLKGTQDILMNYRRGSKA